MDKIRRNIIILLVFTVLCLGFMALAHLIETDFGKVDIETGVITTDLGDISYKLYIPETASLDNKAPAVLLLHGYQNDHETSDAYGIELARRGVVALAIDEYGHGNTSISMIERGYTNHKVSVTYGEDSEEDGTYAIINGQERYKLLLNFSTLSFFRDRYSKGSDGSAVTDSSMGGIDAYAYLATLPFVDNTRMAVTGHSMGTWASWSVAACYSGAEMNGNDISPKAVVLQCGELFRESVYDSGKYSFNNVLLLQAKYDEFSYFRDYRNTVTDSILDSPLRTKFLGIDAENSEWNTTYGDFSDGSARRIELLYTNHRLTTHNNHGMTASLDWFQNALGFSSTISSSNHVFLLKEWLVFFAMILAILTVFPLSSIILSLSFFKDIAFDIPVREDREKKGWAWWKGALITIGISALTYPFLTQLGHGLLPLPESIFRMTIGNAFLCWYLFLIIIMVLTTVIPFRKGRKKGSGVDYVDLGLSRLDHKDRLDWKLLGKSALAVFILLLYIYILLGISKILFTLDFRFIWPFFRIFTFERFLQFLVYIPVFAIFFILNNSKIMAQMRIKESIIKGVKAFFTSWWHNALLMVGGILLIVLIEYIPFFLGIGPGADLLFSPTFGGPFMSLLIVFVPQVIVFSFICTYFYRKTGNVYMGALLVSSMACWIITGGSAIL